jgi:predicted PurR-regulated permease PerM
MEADGSIRTNLERLMPAEGRQRRLVGWGVVAWTAIGAIIVVAAAFRVLGRIAGVFPYVVVAVAVVFALEPLTRRVAALGIPRRVAATLVFVVALAVVGTGIALLVPTLIGQARNLAGSSPTLVRKGGGLFDELSRSSNAVLRNAGDTAKRWIDQHAGNAPRFLGTLASAGLRLAHFSLVLLVGGVLGFLLLLSLPETARGAAALVPPRTRERFEPTWAEVRRIVGGYVRARLIVSLVVGALATIGLWAIHMPFWLVLGLIVGAANVIPMLGSWIGGIPVAAVALTTKPPSFLFVVLAVVVMAHLVDGFFLSPIVLKETTDLHPVVILLAVIVGAELFGFWGILAAIPVAGVAQFLIRQRVLPRWTGTAPTDEPVPIGTPAAGAPG